VKPLRLAFLTPTFATEADSGGMGAYLHRLTRALRDLGHEPEVFTLTDEVPGLARVEDVRVERVSPARDLPLRLIARCSRVSSRTDLTDATGRVQGALALARAFEKRHREMPFDVVQSSDYGLAGLFVGRDSARRHLVRCSWASDLFIEADGRLGRLDSRLYCLLERYCIRKADLAYAPSQFVADYYRRTHSMNVEVLRPPFLRETEIAAELPWELPTRYLMYFGAICPRKGTDVLAAALPLVWQEEPEFAMVWAGETWDGALESYRRLWADRSSQVSWVGYIPKPQLYAVLRGAEAVVIPSRVDNLPNTLIESLLLQVPVIGSRGASIDELVEPGRNGELVPIGAPEPLAAALLRAWRREVPWRAGQLPVPRLIEEMDPLVAAAKFLRLAAPATTSPLPGHGTPAGRAS
jgi:glycosyltransferase involved in cell wall biosynthesis